MRDGGEDRGLCGVAWRLCWAFTPVSFFFLSFFLSFFLRHVFLVFILCKPGILPQMRSLRLMLFDIESVYSLWIS